MAKVARTPKIRQVVEFTEEGFDQLVELAEHLEVGNPEAIRRAIAEMHAREVGKKG